MKKIVRNKKNKNIARKLPQKSGLAFSGRFLAFGACIVHAKIV